MVSNGSQVPQLKIYDLPVFSIKIPITASGKSKLKFNPYKFQAEIIGDLIMREIV